MCGISGSVNFNDPKILIQRMNRSMRHRGPDGEGFFIDGAVAIGIRRLKIIDLKTGDQPIFNEDGTIAVVFNGEIYNFRELRDTLKSHGHVFSTQSDTEVIVHAYEQWGIEFADRLRGMFAIALYDFRQAPNTTNSRRWTVVLVRDRLGIKPLYFCRQENRFLFASEVRAILASGEVKKIISSAGAFSYLLFGSVQEPLTLVENVFSIPPGTWMRIQNEGSETSVSNGRFWTPGITNTMSTFSVEDLRQTFLETVSCHLISEVPLGVFLSGGLDSGALTAMAQKSTEHSLQTFTLGFENWPSDEREDAASVARWLGTNHNVRIISIADMLYDLPQAIRGMDQPSFDGVNTWYISREARRAGLTVALSGVGGDEVFGGYPSFHSIPWMNRIAGSGYLIPYKILETLALSFGGESARKFAQLLKGRIPMNHPYFLIRQMFSLDQVSTIFGKNTYNITESPSFSEWKASVESDQVIARQFDSMGEISWLELSQYTRSTLLRDTDSMSMANSLEIRVPFLDHCFVDQILSLPKQRKMHRSQNKYLLAELVKDMLPESFFGRTKRTFTLPFELWMKGELGLIVGNSNKNHILAELNLIDAEACSHVWTDFEKGKTTWARPWSLYVLNEWLRLNL